MARKIGITKQAILDVAEGLVQTRGYNGFSYKDIAQALGMRTASLHHHFPSKAILGQAVAARYRGRFADARGAIAAQPTAARAKLEDYADLFRTTLGVDRRLCLCGMLGAEAEALPEPVRAEVAGFFQENEAWLAAQFAAGRGSGELRFAGAPEAAASLFLALLEGAMILARATRSRGRFNTAIAAYLDQI